MKIGDYDDGDYDLLWVSDVFGDDDDNDQLCLVGLGDVKKCQKTFRCGSIPILMVFDHV